VSKNDTALTMKEACKLLKLDRRAVTALIDAGRLPAGNVSLSSKRREFRIARANVENFLNGKGARRRRQPGKRVARNAG
jgi:excisionase family DNA binding protein